MRKSATVKNTGAASELKSSHKLLGISEREIMPDVNSDRKSVV